MNLVRDSFTRVGRLLSKYIRSHNQTVVDIVLISMIGLLSLSWFQGDFLIEGGDMNFPLSLEDSFKRSLYLWSRLGGLGNLDSRVIAQLIPQEIWFLSSNFLRLSLVDTEKVIYYSSFTLSGLSMYFLTSILVKGEKKRIAGLASALFYMMNPYAMTFILPYYSFCYTFLPLKLALFIKGLNEKKGFRFIFLMSLLWLITTTSSYVNPVFCIIDWTIISFYLVFYILTNRRRTEITTSLRFALTLVLIWALLNMYWIIPQGFFAKQEMELATSTSSDLDALLTFRLNSAPLISALRLSGYWAYESTYKGEPYIIWASVYSSGLFIVLSFLIPILAFSPLLTKAKNKHVYYFSAMAIVGIILVTGSNPPFGEIVVWLLTFSNTLPLFRQGYQKFGIIIALSYAFLIGFALRNLYLKEVPRVKNRARILLLIRGRMIPFLIMFLLLGVYAYPYWTGDVIRPAGEILPSNRVKIPDYYYEAAKWLHWQSEAYNILTLPLPRSYYMVYSWGYGGGDPTMWLFLPKTVISSGLSDNSISGIAAELILENFTSVTRMLTLMNVKYVLFHKDANWAYIEGNRWFISAPLNQSQSILNSQEGLSSEQSFGELYFYRNEYWRPMHIYATSNAQLVEGGLDEMIRFVERDDFTPSESVLFLSNQLDAQQISALPRTNSLHSNSTDNVSVTCEKINPTLYNVQVNASKPLFLVFSESYHKDWTAYIDGQQIPNEYHYMANGFANSWYINKTGSFRVTLEFWPQRLFYIGATVSITTLILCTIYISKDKVKTIYKQYAKKNIPQNLQRQSDDTPTTPEDLKVQQKEDPSSV